MLLALLTAAAETEHGTKPLDPKSLLVTVAVILVICGVIMLAGFGYFSPSDDATPHH